MSSFSANGSFETLCKVFIKRPHIYLTLQNELNGSALHLFVSISRVVGKSVNPGNSGSTKNWDQFVLKSPKMHKLCSESQKTPSHFSIS